jgi:hypothetical protein
MCAACGFCGSWYGFTNCSLFAKPGSLIQQVCQFGFDAKYRVKICIIVLAFAKNLFQNCLEIVNLPQNLFTPPPNPSQANKHGAFDLFAW